MRDGEAVRDPADSPYAVALAVRYQRGLSIPWRKRAVYWIATLPFLAYWYWVGGLWYAAGWFIGLVVFSLVVRTWFRRTAANAVEAERRNREIAHFNRLELKDPG